MFKKKTLSLSIAMVAALGSSYVAVAQEDQLEEVVVTGIRSSVTKALDIKRNNLQVVDSIVAEDIGKLPDNSVAAALQRVPGVQITRSNGEASGVVVRGLPNVVTTLNGRNIFTTTGRGVALADIPADLLQRVDVKKSSSASDIEGGVAGLVDVRLRRPFDFDGGLTIAGGIRGEYSEQSDSISPIGSVTVNNNWSTASGDMGVMFSVSSQDRKYMEHVSFNVAPDAVTITDPRSAPLNVADQPSLIPGVIGSYYNHGDRNRTSANLAFQFSPDASSEYYAEAFWIGYDSESELNFWVPLPSWGGFAGYVSEYKPGTNVAKTFVRDNFPGTISSNQAFGNESDTMQIAVGGQWEADKLTIKSDLAYTESQGKNRGFILDTAFFAEKIIYDFSAGGTGATDVSILNGDGTAFDLLDPSKYELWQYFDSRSQQDGDDISLSTDVNYSLADTGFTSIDAGFRLSQRNAKNNAADTGGRFRQNILFMSDYDGMAYKTPNDLLSSEVNLTTTQWLTPDRDYIYNNRAQIRVDMGYSAEDPEFLPGNFFDDQENNYAVYGKANYATEIAGMPLDGELGVRVVKLESKLKGFGVSTDVSATEVLPSVNARLALQDDLYLRATAGKTITRPDFVQLNPLTNYFEPTDTTAATGNGGNPNLNAVESVNYDLSLEWYFADSSSLSATVFSRDLDGYIQTYSEVEVRNGREYLVSRPRNTGKGNLDGVELSYTQFFTELPGFWSGFGVQLNTTFMDGESESPITNKMQNLANVSDESYNAVLMYEQDGLSARLAYNWRSEFFLSFNEGGAQPGKSVVVKDEETLDFSISYDLTENLTLFTDATNLLNDPYKNWFGGDSSADESLYPRDIVARERTFSVGVRFSL